MRRDLDLPPHLRHRLDSLAARSNRSAADILQDALENGRSLEWQEQFQQRVEAGITAADRGDFASEADVEQVLRKYRPA